MNNMFGMLWVMLWLPVATALLLIAGSVSLYTHRLRYFVYGLIASCLWGLLLLIYFKINC